MCDQVSYGDHPDQFIRIYAPTVRIDTTENLKTPTVFIIHGGFWRQKYNVDNALVDGFPGYFGSLGWWTVNVEYRRGHIDIDGGQGGWPNTNLDILLALEAFANTVEANSKYDSIDMNNLVIMGHSAGGTLALWACSSNLTSVIEKEPLFQNIRRVLPKLCVPLAPIGDLIEGQLERLSDDGAAISLYMKTEPELSVEGNPQSLAESSPYRLASPHFHFPLVCPSIFVTGDKDTDVPQKIVEAAFQAAVSSSSDLAPGYLQLLTIPDADHYSMVTVSSPHWEKTYNAIKDTLKI